MSSLGFKLPATIYASIGQMYLECRNILNKKRVNNDEVSKCRVVD